MRLLDILFKSAERGRLGLGFIGRKLGFGAKSRRLAEQQATINQLRYQLHEADKALAVERAKYETIKTAFETERKEHNKQKNATAQMWKFIHTRHRLSIIPENDSIEQILRQQR